MTTKLLKLDRRPRGVSEAEFTAFLREMGARLGCSVEEVEHQLALATAPASVGHHYPDYVDAVASAIATGFIEPEGKA